MTHKPVDEYMKNRIRLTPETLTYKYTGLLFGWPLLIVAILALQWACASMAIQQGIADADRIITWRNVFHVVTVISGILSVVFSVGDTGNGPLCTVGRIVMPLADALFIGQPLRRYAHRRARQDPRAEYEAYLERVRQREADAVARKEREAVEGPHFSLPWSRKDDPFLIRRWVEVVATIAEITLYWLIVALLWNAIPFFLAIVFAVLVAVLTIQLAIVLVFVLLTTKPGDDLLKKADQLIALFGRTRR